MLTIPITLIEFVLATASAMFLASIMVIITMSQKLCYYRDGLLPCVVSIIIVVPAINLTVTVIAFVLTLAIMTTILVNTCYSMTVSIRIMRAIILLIPLLAVPLRLSLGVVAILLAGRFYGCSSSC